MIGAGTSPLGLGPVIRCARQGAATARAAAIATPLSVVNRMLISRWVKGDQNLPFGVRMSTRTVDEPRFLSCQPPVAPGRNTPFVHFPVPSSDSRLFVSVVSRAITH